MARPRTTSDAEILKVARRCFLEHGPSVSTTVIAAELGLSQAALFKRFGTKSKLMIAALAPPEKPAYLEILSRPRQPGVTAKQQLRIVVKELDEFMVEHMPALMVLKSSGIDPRECFQQFDVPPPVRAITAITQWVQREVHDGSIRSTDPATVALMILGPVHVRSFLSHLGVSPTESIDELVETLWRGIAQENA